MSPFKEARIIIQCIALMVLPAFAMIINGCGDEGGAGALEKRVIIGPPDEPASTQILAWGVDEINAERVWGGKEGAETIASLDANAGQGVRIAIIGAGIDRYHPDLYSNYVGGVNLTYDTVPHDPNDTTAFESHETMVAGIIAAQDNEVGVIGVAPKAEIYAIKTHHSWTDLDWRPTPDDIVPGIIKAANDSEIDIIVIAWGWFGGWHIDYLYGAIWEAHVNGKIIVASAGNEDTGQPNYPSAFPEVISVSAVGLNLGRLPNSTYGDTIEFAAPGMSIKTTTSWDEKIPRNWGDHKPRQRHWDFGSGTSFAAPHVAGTIALMLSQKPDLTQEQVRSILRATAIDLGAPGRDKYYGHGLIQADKAISCIVDNLSCLKDQY